MNPISFPGLFPWKLHISPVVFSVGNFSLRWYGILIALGLLLAMFYGMKRAKDFSISVDDLTDVIIFALIFAIIGARLYYVIFYTPLDTDGSPLGMSNPFLKDPISILYTWEGGLGIYGGMIAAFVTAFIVCRIKKISVGAVFDLASLGFLIGQAIGRWGNFFNQEAYGVATNLPWRMRIFDQTLGGYVNVHPCFLYESLWCVLGFVLLHNYSKRHRKFNGEIFLLYVMWYSFGRFIIEGLRSDSLYFGLVKVSQLVAAVAFLAAAAMLIYTRRRLSVMEVESKEYVSVYGEAAQAMKEEEKELERLQHANAEPGEDEDETDDGDASEEEEGFPDDGDSDPDDGEPEDRK